MDAIFRSLMSQHWRNGPVRRFPAAYSGPCRYRADRVERAVIFMIDRYKRAGKVIPY